jgi:hypothetical protein
MTDMSDETIHDEMLPSCLVQIEFINRNTIFSLFIFSMFPIILGQIDFVFYVDGSGRGIKMSSNS